jgi:hypothetical protein
MTLALETPLSTGRHAFFAEVPAKGVEGDFAHAIAPGGTRAATDMWCALANGRARR